MSDRCVKKEISLGKVDGYGNGRKLCPVTLEIRIYLLQRPTRTIDLEPAPQGSECLSICGNIWNSRRSDIICGGQCHEELRRHFRDRRFLRIAEIWERWHLNDMKCGTRPQDEYLRKALTSPDNPWRYDYNKACEMLRDAGLYEDRGYKYGHEWLFEPIPAEVVAEIKTLFGIEGTP